MIRVSQPHRFDQSAMTMEEHPRDGAPSSPTRETESRRPEVAILEYLMSRAPKFRELAELRDKVRAWPHEEQC
jgi:hypothetical protein